MEGGEMEMTEKELQRWIRRKVRSNQLIVALVKKRKLLRSLLKRRENQANQLQQLSRLLATCEGLVKRHYSLLGWEYQYTCSDDEIGTTEYESSSTPETPDHVFPTASRLSPSLQKSRESPNLCTVNEKTFHIDINRQPVVVLDPLPPGLISSLHPPMPETSNTENEDFKSDSSWKPDSEEDSDSDFYITNDDAHPKKRQKVAGKNKEEKDSSTDRASAEICIDMDVLARNHMNIWQKGKVIEIISNAYGVQMYKVCFEDEKKDLVYGPHMAFGNCARLDQLSLGSRVVVEREDQAPRFCPGILAELPTLKNKYRLMVFFNDHTPIYVTINSVHCLCEPLENPLDDISDEMHKSFMQEYFEKWPYVPRVQYSVGEKLSATFNGQLHACEVLVTDSSLIQVVFEPSKQKEWIYRGSPRLEHMQRNKMVLKCQSQDSQGRQSES